MANTGRSEISPVMALGKNKPQELYFFQAVRNLLAANDGATVPGTFGAFRKEQLLFRAVPSLAFPNSDVHAIAENEAHPSLPPVWVEVNFLGLYGPSSPLPSHYTERILHSDPEDAEVRHFLDLFNHRLVSLLYRAWLKYRIPLAFRPGATDHYSNRVFSLIGLMQAETRTRDRLDWERLLPFVGLLAMRTGSKESIRRVVANYCRVPDLEIDENVEQILEIPTEQLCRLGLANSRLGSNAMLGSRVRDRNGRFSLTLPELTMDHYMKLLPGGETERDVAHLIRFVSKDTIDYTLSLQLKLDEASGCAISKASRHGLGRNAWLGTPTRNEQVTIKFN